MTEFFKGDDCGITHVRSIPQSMFANCPHLIMTARHYREDGTCKCSNEAERAKMIKQDGYRARQFKGVKLID